MQPAWAPGSSSRGCLAQLCLGLGLRASPKTAALTSQVVLMYLCWYLQKLLQSYDENLDPEATKRAFNARSTHTKKTCKALKTKTPNPKIKTLNPYPPPPPPPHKKKKRVNKKKQVLLAGTRAARGSLHGFQIASKLLPWRLQLLTLLMENILFRLFGAV